MSEYDDDDGLRPLECFAFWILPALALCGATLWGAWEFIAWVFA